MFSQKEKINCFLTNMSLKYSSVKIAETNESLIYKNEKFELIFLEFGAKGCIPCKMMDEIFRHVGYFPIEELSNIFEKTGVHSEN
jgi:hypothetical protein